MADTSIIGSMHYRIAVEEGRQFLNASENCRISLLFFFRLGRKRITVNGVWDSTRADLLTLRP